MWNQHNIGPRNMFRIASLDYQSLHMDSNYYSDIHESVENHFLMVNLHNTIYVDIMYYYKEYFF